MWCEGHCRGPSHRIKLTVLPVPQPIDSDKQVPVIKPVRTRRKICAAISVASKQCLGVKKWLQQAIFLFGSGRSPHVFSFTSYINLPYRCWGIPTRCNHAAGNATAVAIVSPSRAATSSVNMVSVSLLSKRGRSCRTSPQNGMIVKSENSVTHFSFPLLANLRCLKQGPKGFS